jgi:hypothetical protein
MTTSSRPSSRRWLRATWLGWLLGVPSIALLALLAEAAHLGGLQVFVGAGMGLGVGLLQARVLRPLAVPRLAWIVASAVGLALPFLAWDVAEALGVGWKYYLVGCVAAGGLVVGCWQAVLLRAQLNSQARWIVASVLGWGLAGALATGADLAIKGQALRGLGGALLYIALVTLPGGVLGLVTGRVLSTDWRAAAGSV